MLVGCVLFKNPDVKDYMDNRTPIYKTKTSLSPQEFIDCINANQPPEFLMGPAGEARYVPVEEKNALERVVKLQWYWLAPTKFSNEASVSFVGNQSRLYSMIIEGDTVEWYYISSLRKEHIVSFTHYQKVCG